VSARLDEKHYRLVLTNELSDDELVELRKRE